MNIGDKVKVRTGKPGKPPHGVIVALGEVGAVAVVKVGKEERAVALSDLTVIPDGK